MNMVRHHRTNYEQERLLIFYFQLRREETGEAS